MLVSIIIFSQQLLLSVLVLFCNTIKNVNFVTIYYVSGSVTLLPCILPEEKGRTSVQIVIPLSKVYCYGNRHKSYDPGPCQSNIEYSPPHDLSKFPIIG